MKKVSRSMLVALSSFFMMMIVMCIAPKVEAAGVDINFPAERAIFQRGDNNTADITVKATFYGNADKVQARVRYADGETEWAELSGSGNYEGVIYDVEAGGWYTIEVQAVDGNGNVVGDGYRQKIGVGEVFITGGQSNSANFGGGKTTASHDEVSALNGNNGAWQHCADSQPCTSGFNTGNGGGSPWPTLGDKLYEKLGVPIGFVCTGQGSAKVSELAGNLYGNTKKGIDAVKPYGCRAFLLHQGEADAPGTPNDSYRADLLRLIQQTRNDFGYDINWIIAQVSYAWSGYNDTAKMNAHKATQRSVCNNYNIFVGPDTDDLQGDYRHTDNLHFSVKGLIEHGNRWANVIIDKLFTGHTLNADEWMEGGTVEQCGNTFNGGSVVTLSAVPDKGYYFVPGSFKVTGSEGDIPLENDSFIMRSEDLTVSAEFARLPEYFFTLDAKITEAESIDGNYYEDAGVQALNSAIEAAKAVFADVNSDETAANNAIAAIEDAIKGLVMKPFTDNGGQNPSADNNPGTPGNPGISVTPGTTANVGDIVAVGNVKYKVTAAGSVTVAGLVNKNKASVVIPKAVNIGNATYKVIAIEKKAFAGAKKLKKITIKSTTIKKIGKNAFSKINAKAKFKVPAKKLAAYKKLIKKAGFKKMSAIKK